MAKPTVAALVGSLKELQDRINSMEQERAQESNHRLALLAGDHALREALLQFTQEIAARDGFSVPLFVSRFEKAVAWHRDRFLQMVEGVDPETAAQIDQRSLSDIPTDELPPCIFPN